MDKQLNYFRKNIIETQNILVISEWFLQGFLSKDSEKRVKAFDKIALWEPCR